jgi:hypothetical protein
VFEYGLEVPTPRLPDEGMNVNFSEEVNIVDIDPLLCVKNPTYFISLLVRSLKILSNPAP